MKSLNAQGQFLVSGNNQVLFLEQTPIKSFGHTTFQEKLEENGLYPFRPTQIEIFQINLGKMCNQVCKHCHVDAGPDRKEIMVRETMDACISAIKKSGAHTVDLTGGAPEMNPDFRYFVERLSILGIHIIVRCNLTIIVANPKYNDLPEFFKKHNIEVVSSLPYFTALKTDAQRGEGVFEKSIKGLRMLNAVGYGIEGTGLTLNLVYNPSGAFLPPDESSLKLQFQRKLNNQYDIYFNNLFAITNLPISRFLDYLIKSENYESYMEKLIERFNPNAAKNAMCRNTISVGWDGYLYDCDFNQMLNLPIKAPKISVDEFDTKLLEEREIVINKHCFGCTAGAGSSCGGATS